MTMSNPEEIGFQLDNLLEEVEETSQIIDDLDKDILPLHSDIDDIDIDSDFLEIDNDTKQKTESESKVNNQKRAKE
jgi:vacuolar-type H+-ATPase subunit D/Vma8